MADRIFRSLYGILNIDENVRATHHEDFIAELEVFQAYLQAQLNGNSELGGERINDKDLRESLESIKSDTDDILIAGSINIRKTSAQIFAVSKAVKDNQQKANDIF